MDFRLTIFYMLFTIIQIQSSCHFKYDTENCKLSADCIHDICQVVSRKTFQNYLYSSERAQCQQKKNYHGPPIQYNGGDNQFDKIYLRLETPLKDEIFYCNNYYDAFLGYVYSIDISNNNISNNPTISGTPNLGCLNMSRNQLTTASLSNPTPFNSLREIDFSYNNIYEISINSNEHRFTKLINIQLSHNHITKIPDGIFDTFDDLNTLDLSFNYIDSLSPSTFEGVKNLVNLNLSNNKLTDLNSSLFRFSALVVLNLGHNNIKNIYQKDFEKMIKLEILNLASNMIKKLDANIFVSVRSLKVLDISDNGLEILDKDCFSGLDLLTKVDIFNNNLESIPRGLFKNKFISHFSIENNSLKGSLSKGVFEGVSVKRLNLGRMFLTTIKDYAFNNMTSLEILFLNSNNIETLDNFCFMSLENLQELDLSYNQIFSIDFNKDDLKNLRILKLRNNHLLEITNNVFINVYKLEYLDISENFISYLEPNSFKILRNLINLELSNNILNGTLKTGSFNGLTSLPNLDISSSLLETIENASFSDMTEMKSLNMSHNKITDIQFNVLIFTRDIETLDFSYNNLKTFLVNFTDVSKLRTLILNNNLLRTISLFTFNGISSLRHINLAYNIIETIHNDSLKNQTGLQDLNLSYNEKLEFHEIILQNVNSLQTINLSGVKFGINFTHLTGLSVSDAFITNAGIQNITNINIKSLKFIVTLVLSNNNVNKLEIGAFTNMSALKNLDISFNQISYIQPGVFKDNSLLNCLNISHNALFTISYGIFRGLLQLQILDLSYNRISNLENERFYEVHNLNELIVDNNRISSIDIREVDGTSLKKLSIGDNPLPCKELIELKKRRNGPYTIEITSIIKDEHNSENVDGVTCNKNQHFNTKTLPEKSVTISSDYPNSLIEVFYDIKTVLTNLTNLMSKTKRDSQVPFSKNVDEAINIKSEFAHFSNITSTVVAINNNTNMLLAKILNSITATQIPTLISNTEQPEVRAKGNETIDVIAYMNKLRQELQNSIALEKHNILKEISDRYKTESSSVIPISEKFESSKGDSKSVFTETCVAFILVILVGFILYKVYKSRIFIRSNHSTSTRELPGAMCTIENSNV